MTPRPYRLRVIDDGGGIMAPGCVRVAASKFRARQPAVPESGQGSKPSMEEETSRQAPERPIMTSPVQVGHSSPEIEISRLEQSEFCGERLRSAESAKGSPRSGATEGACPMQRSVRKGEPRSLLAVRDRRRPTKESAARHPCSPGGIPLRVGCTDVPGGCAPPGSRPGQRSRRAMTPPFASGRTPFA